MLAVLLPVAVTHAAPAPGTPVYGKPSAQKSAAKGYSPAGQPYVPPPPPSSQTTASKSATSSTTATRTGIYVPPGTQPYNMDFTLPTLGKAGCMVCHGDRNLIRIKGDQYISFYVDDAVMRASAHANTICTGCHLDFAYKAPHKTTTDWARTAKQACKNCHQPEFDEFNLGAHAVNDKPGQPDPKADAKPLCGDCHGSHDIVKLTNNPAARADLRANGYEVCGRCHQKEWEGYADYYHGAAYRRGAPDAPACWDCHGAHTVLPSSDSKSPTNPDNLAQTCSGSLTGRSCHTGVSDAFLSYTALIHQRRTALQDNALYSTMTRVREGISGLLSNIVGTVRSWFT